MQSVVLIALVAVVCGQFNNQFNHQPSGQNGLPCGFTCSRRSSFSVSIDGSWTTATCTANGANPKDRCPGCCASRALAAGLSTDQSAGFPSTNSVDCICCINNNRCRK